MGHHKVIGIIVILSCVLSSTILAQDDVLSPCPKIFNYQFDGNQWFGIINVPSPPLGTTLRLNLKLSIKTKLPSKYIGQVELLGERGDLIQKMINGWNLDYKVHFPLINPIPKVTSILFNGASICSGPPEMFTASGQYVTSIDLQHVLYTGGQENPGPGTSPISQPPEISPPIRPENPFIDSRPDQNPFFNTQSQNQNSFRPGQNSNFNTPNSWDQASYRPGQNSVYNQPNSWDQTSNRPGQNSVFNQPNSWDQTSNRPGQNSYNQPEPVTNNLYFDLPTNNFKPQRPQSSSFNNPFLSNVRTTTRRPWNVYRPNVPDFSSQDYDEERPNPGNFAKPQTTTTVRAPIYPTYPQNNQYRCGKPQGGSIVPLIIGGQSTSRDEWPWLVAMFKKGETGPTFHCAGSLISNRVIVTAAHCIRQKNNPSLKTYEIVLKLGAHDLQDWTDENTKISNVEHIITHPAYSGATLGLKSDIAVLVMKAVQFTHYISPICLWEGDANLNSIVGRKGTVVGWGRDGSGLLATPRPRQTQVPIVSTDVCRGSKQEFSYFTSNTTICAGEKDGTGPCSGDSGGGMFIYNGGKWMLRGIVSNSLPDPRSTNPCNLHEYVIYTDVAKFSSWIEQIMYQYNG